MAFLINLNGTITLSADAKISVLDRGFLYGDSVYEVVRTYQGKVFALDRHLERLEHSASRLAIPLPSPQKLTAEIKKTLRAAQNEESYCRLVITRGTGPLTLDPTSASNPVLIIFVKEYEPFPDWMYLKGIRLAVPSVRRTARDALDPAIKSGNYLNSVLALGEVKRRGFDDALILDRDGRVTESTSSNVFAAKGGELLTPALDAGLLAGVTRGLILMLAHKHGIMCREQQLTPDDLVRCDEVMLTSTLREVMPVAELDTHKIGSGKPGPMSKRLKEIFHDYALQVVSKAPSD